MSALPRTLVAAVLLSVAGFGGAAAQEFKAGDLSVDRPWSRATPAGAKVAAGYMVINNKGASTDRLVGISSSLA